MQRVQKSSLFLLVAILVLAACGGQAAGEPTPDVNATLTAGVGTVIANFFETQTAMAPPASPTASITPLPLPTTAEQAIALPTLGVAASPTPYIIYPSPTVTGTVFTPTVNPASLALGCNNLQFIGDVSVPAGTVMKPGQSFTKTWKVANSGTCEWVYLYGLVFTSGTRMNGEPARLGKVIPPGKWTQLSVALDAPEEPGTYTAVWQMSDQSGKAFGSQLSVSIVVASPTKTPEPPTATSTATATPTTPPPAAGP